MSLKVILTGATGFVGGEVLAQCRRNPDISSIVVLTRRPLPGAVSDDPKVKQIVMKDFKVYSDDAKRDLEGADACVWALGARMAVPEVEIDYPLALARTIVAIRPSASTKPFRYIYCSGVAAERDQTKPLWFSQTVRRTKGRAESSMLDFAAAQGEGVWETYIVKPGMITRPGGDGLKRLVSDALVGSVRVDELAAMMVEVVSGGAPKGQETFLNAESVDMGREVLDKREW
ncbi:NAD(P)-bd-dom domain-containing protein [Mycena chlorophos]|uniref:NAD(P)-bd-dom domain-containing protein n=1 Tax=Mycena chlorophos TaxID=658473 RepID=A0A8H6T0A7_MYCCL|nr:NAD(P)-bd-dom domain-containing protein [Mycena chlorophos]